MIGQPKLWVYNYDFEFEFAGQPRVVLNQTNLTPWYFLNRSSSLFLPLADPGDAILSYEKPDTYILDALHQRLGYMPDWIQLNPSDHESNSVFFDLEKATILTSAITDFQLSPWGWNRTAMLASNRVFSKTINLDLEKTIRMLNSKQFSFSLREENCSRRFSIPALTLSAKNISEDEFASIFQNFYRQHSSFFVKHYFGTAGKLSDFCQSDQFAKKKTKKWKTWIDKSGGILLEKKIPVVNEWSIQLDIESDKSISPLCLTKLYSGKDRSYVGNILSDSYFFHLERLLSNLEPILKIIAGTGYHGAFGIDLIETDKGEFKLTEINARHTMGRISYEWHKAINPFPYGLFSNFFLKKQKLSNFSVLADFCKKLENDSDCLVSIINYIASPSRDTIFASLFIGAGSEEKTWDALNTIKSTV
ncbi:hypothetical protein KKA14_20625 [bacterium]|nr:hypothetical protein [bacterium]